jgi:hypothetical protein
VAGLLQDLIDQRDDIFRQAATAQQIRDAVRPYLARDLGAAQAADEVARLRARLAEVEAAARAYRATVLAWGQEHATEAEAIEAMRQMLGAEIRLVGVLGEGELARVRSKETP